ncbi:MAG TPA: hypothetical protein VGE25_09745 [Sediminibacterium sp.]
MKDEIENELGLTGSCIVCEKKFYGRSDKKFCGVRCKNQYHNTNTVRNTKLIRSVNYLLRKNRNILYTLTNGKRTAKTMKRDVLLIAGFDFSYITSVDVSQEQTTYYCYDYQYIVIGETQVQIQRQPV